MARAVPLESDPGYMDRLDGVTPIMPFEWQMDVGDLARKLCKLYGEADLFSLVARRGVPAPVATVDGVALTDLSRRSSAKVYIKDEAGYEFLDQAVRPHVATCLKGQKVGVEGLASPPSILFYKEGDFFNWHRDRGPSTVACLVCLDAKSSLGESGYTLIKGMPEHYHALIRRLDLPDQEQDQAEPLDFLAYMATRGRGCVEDHLFGQRHGHLHIFPQTVQPGMGLGFPEDVSHKGNMLGPGDYKIVLKMVYRVVIEPSLSLLNLECPCKACHPDRHLKLWPRLLPAYPPDVLHLICAFLRPPFPCVCNKATLRPSSTCSCCPCPCLKCISSCHNDHDYYCIHTSQEEWSDGWDDGCGDDWGAFDDYY